MREREERFREKAIPSGEISSALKEPIRHVIQALLVSYIHANHYTQKHPGTSDTRTGTCKLQVETHMNPSIPFRSGI